MATAEAAPRPQEKSSRLKPLAWMKRLANIKHSSSDRGRHASKKHNGFPSRHKASPPSHNGNFSSPERVQNPPFSHSDGHSYDDPARHLPNGSSNSLGPTIETNPNPAESNSLSPTIENSPGTVHSEGDYHSKAGTSNTAGGAMSSASGGGNSIFSSSNHSSHSLTTTLTTIQSAPSSNILNQHASPTGTGAAAAASPSSQSTPHHQTQPSQASSYFHHQYPTTPASAVPMHLNPHSHMPTTYRSATANNLLTDNASVITLASSSNQRVRRNSLDTNASIRAIAPSSVWGGSRESLPLSVLSQSTTNEPAPASATGSAGPTTSPVSTSHNPSIPSQLVTTAGGSSTQQQGTRPHSSLSGFTSPTERGSVYSSGGGAGVGAPALSSERNSIYAGKAGATGTDGASLKGAQGADGSSVRSGLIGHGRSESTAGSIGGYNSPLATPKETTVDGEKED